MARGIIYTMTTVVPGLIKIGKTGSLNYKQRMDILEKNGYSNVVGLKRSFAIEVDDYDEKEQLLHTIFSKSRVERTELFSVDIELVNQLLSSFEGTQVFPLDETKNEVFDQSAENRGLNLIPDGEYYLRRKVGGINVDCRLCIINNDWMLLKGSVLATEITGKSKVSEVVISARQEMKINRKGILVENYKISSNAPSFAAMLVTYKSCNGWTEWKNSKGESIDVYREK